MNKRRIVVLVMIVFVAVALSVYAQKHAKPRFDGEVKAWVSFDGTACTGGDFGNECEPTRSFNIKSIVRDSAGVYTVTWQTSFVDSSYAVNIISNAPINQLHAANAITAESAILSTRGSNFIPADAETIHVMAVGRLD